MAGLSVVSLAWCAVLLLLPTALVAQRVGVVSNYNSASWDKSAPCQSTLSNKALVECNLQV